MSSAEAFSGSRVIATDGMIGRVVDLLFDDEKWAIRYLVVNAGDWLPRNRVLISPHSVRFVNAGARLVVAGLTLRQVAGSPRLDPRSQITRQQEWDYCAYFGLRLAADGVLHSFRAVSGFLVQGTAEQLGRVDDLLFDERTWAIQRIVIAAGRWLEGRRFEVAPEQLGRIDWSDRWLMLGVKRADIRRGRDWHEAGSRGS